MSEKTLESKTDCVSILKTIFESFLFGHIVCQRGYIPDSVWKGLADRTLRFPEVDGQTLDVKLKVICDKVTTDQQREAFHNHFRGSLLRAFVAECYEVVKLYCVKSKQDPKFVALPWYQFPRLIRNLVSHTDAGQLSWPQNLKDKGITSVTWRHRTLDTSMVGKEVAFSSEEAALLYRDLLGFVEDKLD